MHCIHDVFFYRKGLVARWKCDYYLRSFEVFRKVVATMPRPQRRHYLLLDNAACEVATLDLTVDKTGVKSNAALGKTPELAGEKLLAQSRGVLSGSRGYDSQAFRFVCQAHDVRSY